MHRVIWIGGWATDLVCWQSEIAQIYPQWKHTYWDAMEPGEVMTRLDEINLKVKEKTWVLGWSLGSLLLHQWLMKTANPSLHFKFASLNPVFDFCEDKVGWSSRVLEKMRRKLKREKDVVQEDFFMSMVQNVNLTKHQIELWREYHKEGHSVNQLIEGLSYLENNSVDLQAFIKRYHKHTFFSDTQDPISPPLRFPRDIAGVINIKGHVPFLTEKQRLVEWLEEV